MYNVDKCKFCKSLYDLDNLQQKTDRIYNGNFLKLTKWLCPLFIENQSRDIRNA